MKKICLLLVIFFCGSVFGIECGNIPTSGCIITQNTNFSPGEYYISEITIIKDNIILDCNGATLVGDKTGNGIYNQKFKNVEIKNCNIKNYTNGIYLDSYYEQKRGYNPSSNNIHNNILEENGIGIKSRGHSERYPSANHKIYDNILRSNSRGIYFTGTANSQIFNNTFKENSQGINFRYDIKNNNIYENQFVNNSNYGIFLDSGNWASTIYSNVFSKTGIRYMSTGSNSFCLGNLSNKYINGATGPPCDCLPLANGLSINSNENICNKEYNLSFGVKIIKDNVILDCNGATLMGIGIGNGIYNQRFKNIEIKNCKVKNYTNGIYLAHIYEYNVGCSPSFNNIHNNILEENGIGIKSRGHSERYPSASHKIYDNILKNNGNGVYFRSTVGSQIFNNTFKENSQGISLQHNAKNNNIFSNDFLVNKIQTKASELNYWNNSKAGNYWENYDSSSEGCYDKNNDLICDSPLIINNASKNIDYLPIIKKYCNGEINIHVKDSLGNDMSGLFAYLYQNQSITNDDGFTKILTTGKCRELKAIEVKCQDQITSCGNRSVLTGYDGDIDYLEFTCDACRTGKDIFIKENELKFEDLGNEIRINVTLHSIGINQNIKISLIKNCYGQKSLHQSQIIPISSMENKIISFQGDFSNCQKIDITAEYLEREDYFENNFIKDFPILYPPKVYLNIDTKYSYVDEVIEDFLSNYIQATSKRDAEVEIIIGRKLYEIANLEENLLDDKIIRFNGKKEGLFYSGLIQPDFSTQKPKIYVFGNDIDGTIAAVKELVKQRREYLNMRPSYFAIDNFYLSKSNPGAISVFDYLHKDENRDAYKKNNKKFAKVVEEVLSGDILNMEVKRVLTSNDETSLRVKHISSEYSEEFLEFLSGTGKPVVMAGGLFNNLYMWEGDGEGLAIDLANAGHDVWEIEITGGPNSDCPACPDYTYDDLVDYYWPALVSTVQYYTGKISLNYVGFSNGCRTALSSLEKYQETGRANAGKILEEGVYVDLEGSVDNPVVDTFVGIGCPGAFEGESYLMEQVSQHPDSVEKLREKGLLHVDIYDVAKKLANYGFIFLKFTDSISLNLWSYYDNIISSNEDIQPGNFSVNNSLIIHGTGGMISKTGNEQDDGMITAQDSMAIFQKINSSNKIISNYRVSHISLTDNKNIKGDILVFLQNGN